MARFVSSQTKKHNMTDIDFRRMASLLFALRLIEVADNPIHEAVEMADKLMDELRLKE